MVIAALSRRCWPAFCDAKRRLLHLAAVLAALVALAAAPPAAAGESLLVIAGLGDARQRVEVSAPFRRAGYDVAVLDGRAIDAAAALLGEIDRGNVAEAGALRPAHLAAFSDAILAAIPRALDYKRIHVVSRQMLPIELAQGAHGFVGDRVAVSHEFLAAGRAPSVPAARHQPLGAYVIEAVMAMPDGMARADQDIVQVALSLERRFPVELHFDSGLDGLRRALARSGIGILHIDTHGSERGRAILASRAGAMLPAAGMPQRVRAPVVLLFGCEGVADAQAFGAVLRERGAEAVVSSFAKFQSFGMTGDAAREKRVYEAFFAAVLAGEDVGTALLRMRQAALAASPATERTLTRLFFVLLGNGQLRLQTSAN